MFCTYVTYSSVGLYYIGKGKTDAVLSGRYKGSGTALTKARKLFKGKWVTEIIQTFTTSNEAFDHEKVLVTKETMSDPYCLNRRSGGKWGIDWTEWTHYADHSDEKRAVIGAKISEKLLAHHARPGAKEAMKEVNAQPQTRKNRSAGAKARFNRPGVREAHKLQQKNHFLKPGALEAHGKAHSKPCTVDGITIYPSQKALAAVLGWSHSTGARSPQFRYVKIDSTDK